MITHLQRAENQKARAELAECQLRNANMLIDSLYSSAFVLLEHAESSNNLTNYDISEIEAIDSRLKIRERCEK